MLLIALAFIAIVIVGTNIAGGSSSRLAGAERPWSTIGTSSLAPVACGFRIEAFGRAIRIEIENCR